MKICVINGPNLQLLGFREPEIYGRFSLDEIILKIKKVAEKLNVEVDFFQSNCEGDIVDKIGLLPQKGYDGIIINPGAYAHTSIAIHDALKAVNLPAIEVHITNTYKRESFRQHSITAAACIGQIMGLGVKGYEYALLGLVEKNI